jgi:triacylglycerol lipase
MSNHDPIVLVHGLFGFNEIKAVGGSVLTYFREIAPFLRDAGYWVPDPPQLNPAGTVASRAGNLQEYLLNHEDIRDRRVHLIAHSMGGLDARYLISKLGMADRVISLATIGTPHEGSPIADWITAASSPFDPMVGNAMRLLGFNPDNIGGVRDLTAAARADFNAAVRDDDTNVRYYTVAGRYEPERDPLFAYPFGLLGLTRDLIQKQSGDNDGLVSVASASFQSRQGPWTHLGTWDANHFRLINWPTNIAGPEQERRDDSILQRYLEIVRRVVG